MEAGILAALAFTFRRPIPTPPPTRAASRQLPGGPSFASRSCASRILMPKDIANPDQVLNCAALSRIDMSGYTSRTPGLYARLCHLCASGKPHSQGTIICEDLS